MIEPEHKVEGMEVEGTSASMAPVTEYDTRQFTAFTCNSDYRSKYND